MGFGNFVKGVIRSDFMPTYGFVYGGKYQNAWVVLSWRHFSPQKDLAVVVNNYITDPHSADTIEFWAQFKPGNDGKGFGGVGGPKVHLHAIIHSDIGRFGFFRHDRRLHFISGGHGEKNLHLLKLFRFHLPQIHKTTNGVRLAEIGSTRKPDPEERKRLHTWFPSSWKGADIKKAGEAISKGKEIKATGLERLKGEYDGVKIKMIVRDGDIKSVFPDSNQKGAGKNGKHAG